MKKLAFCLALTGALASAGTALAEIGTIDAVPAATLLLPYFEVDLANPNGITTCHAPRTQAPIRATRSVAMA